MTDYALKLSDAELERYQYMAEAAARQESDLWTAAGVVEGAAVADVGCGPGAVSVVLARLVGHGGRVMAVDREPETVEAARETVRRAGTGNVTVGVGDATETGIATASVDVVMIRHVLAHNGGREQAIVDHAASLVRPGGHVYLVDIEYTSVRSMPRDLGLADLDARYLQWHEQRRNDLAVGLRLHELLAAAGLEAVEHHGRYHIVPIPPGFRAPSWAGRDALVEAGLADAVDLARWEAAFSRVDGMSPRPTLFAPLFFAFGRRPAP